MVSEVITLNTPLRVTVGEFMLRQVQSPVLLLETLTKEVTYLLNATLGRSLHSHISFFTLFRKLTEQLTTRTTEEELIRIIPHMVSVR